MRRSDQRMRRLPAQWAMRRVLVVLVAATSALPAHRRNEQSNTADEKALTEELQRVSKLREDGILSDDEWKLLRNASVARHRGTSLAHLLGPVIADARAQSHPGRTDAMPPHHVRLPDFERRDVDTAGDNVNVAMTAAPVGAISASPETRGAPLTAAPASTRRRVRASTASRVPPSGRKLCVLPFATPTSAR